MITNLKALFIVTFFCTMSSVFGQWEYHVIDPDIYFTTIASVEDIENDGDMDIVVAHYGANMVLLFAVKNIF